MYVITTTSFNKWQNFFDFVQILGKWGENNKINRKRNYKNFWSLNVLLPEIRFGAIRMFALDFCKL